MYEVALAFSVFCFAAVTIWYVRSPIFSLFHPFTFYTGFHGLIFVFRPIVARILDFRSIYQAFGFEPSPADKLTAILASNLGYLAFALFCIRAGSVPMRFSVDKFTIEELTKLGRVFPWVIGIIGPVGLYSLSVLWNDAVGGAGISGVYMDQSTGVFTHTNASGYLYEAQLMLASACALLAWVYRFHFLSMIPFVLFIVGRSGTGGRGPFVTALATVGLIFLYEKRKKIFNLRVTVITLFAIFLFNMIGADRGTYVRSLASGQIATSSAKISGSEQRFMEGMDLGNLEFFEYLIYVVPQRSGTYDYFLNNLQLFTEPIPRAWWSGKPSGAPIKKVFLFDFGSPVGMTSSLPGIGWYSLGWIGVIIWCGLWGHALGWIYRKFAEGPQNTLQTAAYMVFLPIMIIAFRDGVILTVLRQGLFFLMPVIIWYGISKVVAIPSASVMRQRAFRRWRRARFEARRDAVLEARSALQSVEATPQPDPQPEAESRIERLGRKRRLAYQTNRILLR
jgi:hypothetical protein